MWVIIIPICSTQVQRMKSQYLDSRHQSDNTQLDLNWRIRNNSCNANSQYQFRVYKGIFKWKAGKSVPDDPNEELDLQWRPKRGRSWLTLAPWIGDHWWIWPTFLISPNLCETAAVLKATQFDPAMEAMIVPKTLRTAKMEEEWEAGMEARYESKKETNRLIKQLVVCAALEAPDTAQNYRAGDANEV